MHRKISEKYSFGIRVCALNQMKARKGNDRVAETADSVQIRIFCAFISGAIWEYLVSRPARSLMENSHHEKPGYSGRP